MVNVLDKDKILWYVMRAYKNENTAEDRLSNETYGLEYFIPKQKVLRTVKGKKVFFKEIYIDLKSASNLNGNLNCSKEFEHYASW